MICICSGGSGNTGQRRDSSKRLDDFKNLLVKLIISLLFQNYILLICMLMW